MKPENRFYRDRVSSSSETDFLFHVAHTEKGRPISPGQFNAMLDSLLLLLDIKPGDRVLDLCCGNGLITQHLASRSSQVLGLDASPELIGLAKKYHQGPNVEYRVSDLKNEHWPIEEGRAFDKVLMFAALQHFSSRDLPAILQRISDLVEGSFVVVLGFVPEHGKGQQLHKSQVKDWYYRFLRWLGRDAIGTWWKKETLDSAGAPFGMSCSFSSPPECLRASKYRFDARFTPADDGTRPEPGKKDLAA